MNGALRWWIWAAVAAGAAAALWFAPPPEASVDAGPRQTAAPAPGTARGDSARPAPDTPPAAPVSRNSGLTPSTLRLPLPPLPAEPDDARRFAAMWQLAAAMPAPAASAAAARPAPPPPPVVTSAAAPPAALSWPYRLLGRWRDGERDAVILQGPDGQVAIASQGDSLPGDWRIDTVVANTLVYSHVPSGQRQTLDLGFAR